MKELPRLPKWSIYFLILLTLLLSVVIVANIWFPDIVGWEIFWKALLTYFILIISASVITRMAGYLKSIEDNEEKKAD